MSTISKSLPHRALRALFWVYDRLLLRSTTDFVITVSDKVRARVVASRILREDKVVAIHNGIDVERFEQEQEGRAACRAEFGVEGGDLLVVTVARLVWFKGLRVLIDAAAEVLTSCPSARFLVVGDGPQRAELEQQARELGIGGRVTFAGERADVPRILEAADIFALSSVSEGLPISILEAMATGKPVVATDVGGISELVVDGVNGFLVPAGDPKAFATQLERLAADEQLCRAMGAAGRARAQEKFSTQEMVTRTANLYKALLRPGAPRRRKARSVVDIP